MMGTRCGSIDPGVLIYLMDEKKLDARGLEDLIYKKSGLLGVSGMTSDMRALRESNEPAAREAIELFVYRITREIGSLAASLGGLDGLVFTGGIGQRDAKTRSEVVAGRRLVRSSNILAAAPGFENVATIVLPGPLEASSVRCSPHERSVPHSNLCLG